MTRRGAYVAALLVLTVLVGGRWIMGRQSVEPLAHAAAQQSAPAATPSPATPPPSPSPGDSSQQAAAKEPNPKTTTKKPTGPRSKVGPYGSKRLTGSRGVALTFDDGPHPNWTPRVLDELRAAKVRATFCVVGTQVRKYPALVARIVREGHTLCNHTWNHDLKLGTRPEKEIQADLAATNREIRRAVPGVKVKYFRHPGGKWTANAVKVAAGLRMTSLDWDVDPRDWDKPTAPTIQQRVLDNVRAGSIVLLHDGGGDRAGTLAACPAMISALKRKYGLTLLR
ncbi:polysaccharide deacetylase family protein [Actinomycetes bacterium KLBMP 9797]